MTKEDFSRVRRQIRNAVGPLDEETVRRDVEEIAVSDAELAKRLEVYLRAAMEITRYLNEREEAK